MERLTKREISSRIKDALENDSLVIGKNSVLRRLKTGQLKTVVYASNSPPGLVRNLNHYGSISDITLVEFKGDSAELGEVCGKPFPVLTVGIKK